MSLTADEWRQAAAKARQSMSEALVAGDVALAYLAQTQAAQCDEWAVLAGSDYMIELPALFNLKRELVAAEQVFMRKFGGAASWRITRINGVSGEEETEWFGPSRDKIGEVRYIKDRRRGFLLGTIRAEGTVVMSRDIPSVPRIVRAKKSERPVIVVDNGSQGTRYQDREGA